MRRVRHDEVPRARLVRRDVVQRVRLVDRDERPEAVAGHGSPRSRDARRVHGPLAPGSSTRRARAARSPRSRGPRRTQSTAARGAATRGRARTPGARSRRARGRMKCRRRPDPARTAPRCRPAPSTNRTRPPRAARRPRARRSPANTRTRPRSRRPRRTRGPRNAAFAATGLPESAGSWAAPTDVGTPKSARASFAGAPEQRHESGLRRGDSEVSEIFEPLSCEQLGNWGFAAPCRRNSAADDDTFFFWINYRPAAPGSAALCLQGPAHAPQEDL